MHAFIFWGFLVLLSSVLEAIGQGFSAGFHIKLYWHVISAIAILSGIGFADSWFSELSLPCIAYILRPRRFASWVDMSQIDATVILFNHLLIMVSLLGQYAVRLQTDSHQGGRFLSAALAPILTSTALSTNNILFEVYWWMHIVLVLGFLNYLPYSKTCAHTHVCAKRFSFIIKTKRSIDTDWSWSGRVWKIRCDRCLMIWAVNNCWWLYMHGMRQMLWCIVRPI